MNKLHAQGFTQNFLSGRGSSHLWVERVGVERECAKAETSARLTTIFGLEVGGTLVRGIFPPL